MKIRAKFPRGIVILGLLFAIRVHAEEAKGTPPQPSSAADSQNVSLEERGFELERQNLEVEKQRTAILAAAEARAASESQPIWMRMMAAFATPVSILVSLVVGLLGYRSQAQATRKQLESQFRLKAAELAMDARSSNQVHHKAKALAALFPEELAKFGDTFDPDRYSLGKSVERRQALIEILANHPSERRAILETWDLLYPKDRNEWLKPLLERENLLAKQPDEVRPASQKGTDGAEA